MRRASASVEQRPHGLEPAEGRGFEAQRQPVDGDARQRRRQRRGIEPEAARRAGPGEGQDEAVGAVLHVVERATRLVGVEMRR